MVMWGGGWMGRESQSQQSQEERALKLPPAPSQALEFNSDPVHRVPVLRAQSSQSLGWGGWDTLSPPRAASHGRGKPREDPPREIYRLLTLL